MPATIVLQNSAAQLVTPNRYLIELVRYDLAYLANESYIPSPETGMDGWIRLMTSTGYTTAGLVPAIERLLKKYREPYVVRDERKRPMDELPLHSGIKLRPYQKQLVETFLDRGRGIIVSPPRSGKTLMGGAIVDANPVRWLWTAPTKGIVRQTAKALERALKVGPGEIAELTGGWPAEGGSPRSAGAKRVAALMDARVVVTTAQTAVRMPAKFYATRDGWLVDEFHHAAAATYHDINALAAPTFFRCGLTGTHFRSDENTEILMDAVMSEVVGRVEIAELIELGFLAPVDFVMLPIEGPLLGPCALDTAYRLGVVKHQRRSEWAAWAAQTLMAMGKRVVVLVKLIEHGAELVERIPGAVFVRGADGKEVTDEEVHAAIEDFNAGHTRCLVGTSVLGEGIDLPAADALVYAKGGSASVTVTQDVFRVLTATPGKGRAIVIDFADRHHEGLMRQAVNRGRLYAREPSFDVHVLRCPSDLPVWLSRLRA